jgi:hypothetical protein
MQKDGLDKLCRNSLKTKEGYVLSAMQTGKTIPFFSDADSGNLYY